MKLSAHRPTPSLLLATALCLITACFGAKVPMKSALASYAERPAEGVPAVIDGQDAGRIGWSLLPLFLLLPLPSILIIRVE